MLKLSKAVLPKTKLLTPQIRQSRSFWEYVNMMFNKPDPERIKLVGPDRACAEWVLRNGGKIVWSNGQLQDDYNSLPSDDVRVPTVREINGTDSSISHYGFPHIQGCKDLEKIILHNSSYIENRAMKGLENGKETLTHVQVSSCADVSDSGIKEIKALKNLKTLVLFNLGNVQDLDGCKSFLKSQLPNCEIKGE